MNNIYNNNICVSPLFYETSTTSNTYSQDQSPLLESIYGSPRQPSTTVVKHSMEKQQSLHIKNNTTSNETSAAVVESIIIKLTNLSRQSSSQQVKELLDQTERMLSSLLAESLRNIKLQTVLRQQLDISTSALQQRERIIQEMREDLLKISKQLQSAKGEVEKAKLRHERSAKQNNENFYKIAQQIKERINIKAQKQQSEINHLKAIIASPKGNQSRRINEIINSINKEEVDSLQRIEDKIQGQGEIPVSLKLIIQESSKQIENKSKFGSQVDITCQNNQNINQNDLDELKFHQNSVDLIQKNQTQLDILRKTSSNENPSTNIIPLDDKADLEEIRKFFIHTDLNEMDSIKSNQRINLAQKANFQKAKLHSMFMFKQPQQLGVSSLKKSSHNSNNKSVQLNTTQNQFNKTLSINYHHTKASPLAQQFFQFHKDDENDEEKQNNHNNLHVRYKSTNVFTEQLIPAPRNRQTARKFTVSQQFQQPLYSPKMPQQLQLKQHSLNKSSNSQFLLPLPNNNYGNYTQSTHNSPPKTANHSLQLSSPDKPFITQSPHYIDQGIKTRNEFLQHSCDYHFQTLLLDLGKSDKSIQKAHRENAYLSFLSKITDNEYSFRNLLMNLTTEKYSCLYESMKYVFSNEFLSLNMILKLKKIIQSVLKMHSSLMLTDAFSTIINETCLVLNCDRASVFLIDPRRNEIWTKVAKNSKPIRIPIGVGLAGSVALNGELLNILDAHQDSRFNKEIDAKNNYKTKSVLCIAIKDQNQKHTIGVLQAINKQDGEFFTKEDEGLIAILAQLATAVLRNSLYHDEREVFHNSLKILLESGKILSLADSMPLLVIQAHRILLDKFDVPQANIWIHDYEAKELVRFYYDSHEEQANYNNNKNNNNNTPINNINSPWVSQTHLPLASSILEQRCPQDQGIVGNIFESQNSENILNAYQHPLFNGGIDINTSMPVITLVIRSQIDIHDKSVFRKVGILQCINPKGLESLVFKGQNGSENNIPHAFYETLNNFSQILGENLIKFLSTDFC